MSRRRLVIGNWKMNTTRTEAVRLAAALQGAVDRMDVDVAVCPPFIWIEAVARMLARAPIQVGGQDCWTDSTGAYTGQISAAMLRELCTLVIVGHSEHRRDARENDQLVGQKASAALSVGLTPVVCVGESHAVRTSGEAEAWVSRQVDAVISEAGVDGLKRCVLAYEPLWAIGTGIAAGPEDAQQMARVIRQRVADAHGSAGDSVRILYGGSVSTENAASIVVQPDVDGLLVGGASLDAESFRRIIAAC